MRKALSGRGFDDFLVRKFGFQFAGLYPQLAEVLLSARSKLFVEIGANDGLSQSNTRLLEAKHGWKGVLIEPDPQSYKYLEKIRGGGGNFLENSACVSFDFEPNSIEFEALNLMSTSKELADSNLDLSEHRKKAQQYFSSKARTFTARTTTMTDVLNRAGLGNQYGFLSIDVEGAELEVLGGIDFDTYSFENILIETDNLNSVSDFLKDKSYVLDKKVTDRDFVFKKTL